MSKNFIQRIASWVLDEFRGDTANLNIIFPNKRAGLFLRQELARLADQAIWMPQIYSIEEIFARWASMQQADQLTLMLELLACDAKNGSLNVQFAGYANQLIKEFDEIDHYLVRPEVLFNYLSEAKALEQWHPDGSPLTAYEQSYLHFFRSFERYYTYLHDFMRQSGSASSGAIARFLAELDAPQLIARTEERFSIFAGFNAFSPAEEKVILNLVESNKAALRWDFDAYYIKPNRFGLHEAGAAFRKFKSKSRLISEEWMDNKLLNSKKTIHFVAASGQIGQAKALGETLSQSSGEGQKTSTAVVLADEKLIYPVLNSIPGKNGLFNVTMGLPFTSTQAYGLLTALFELDEWMNAGRNPGQIAVHALLKVLRHDLILASLDKATKEEFMRFGTRLLTENNLYVGASHLANLAADAHPLLQKTIGIITKNTTNQHDTLNKYLEIFGLAEENTALLPNADAMILTTNQAILAQRLIGILIQIAVRYPDLPGNLWLEPLFKQIAGSLSLDFIGEPLEGLQLMGLLESRNLSFDTVHLLSANEGILPRNTHQHSLIPFDIRTTFGLPVRDDSQAVFAFHFFHLIQSAKTIFLYYNSEADQFGKGEMSRFLLQLKHEVSVLNPEIEIIESSYTYKANAQISQRSIAIAKTPLILQKINARLERGLSPTSLSRYLSCSLKFYFHDIMGITEAEEEEEIGITFRQMGIVAHKTIENLYKPYINQPLTKETITDLIQQIDGELERSFLSEMPGVRLEQGMNRIGYIVAQRFVKNLLESDRRTAEASQLIIVEQEKDLDFLIETGPNRVKIKGTIDRIDRVAGRFRIIDYKTGKVEAKEIKLENEEDFSKPEKSKGLQLALYTWVWLEKNKLTSHFPESYLFSLSKTSIGLVKSHFPEEENAKAFCDMMSRFLHEKIAELLNPELKFEKTSDLNQCKICPYANICL